MGRHPALMGSSKLRAPPRPRPLRRRSAQLAIEEFRVRSDSIGGHAGVRAHFVTLAKENRVFRMGRFAWPFRKARPPLLYFCRWCPKICAPRGRFYQDTFLKSTHTLRAQKWVPKRIISRNTAPPVPFLAPIRSATAGRTLTRRPFVDRVGNRRVTWLE